MKKAPLKILYAAVVLLISFTITNQVYSDTILLKKRKIVITGKVLKIEKGSIIFANRKGAFKIKKRIVKKLYATKSYKQDIKIQKKIKKKIDRNAVKADYTAGLKYLQQMEEETEEAEDDYGREDRYTPRKRTEFLLGLGAGGYMTLGVLGDKLNPGYYGKCFVQYSGFFKKYLGAELDVGYAYLGDKEYEGGIRFIYFMPSAVYRFQHRKFKKRFELQAKAGFGITSVSTELSKSGRTHKESSNDLTVSGGISFIYNIDKKLFTGLDLKYYYIFETIESSTVSANLLFGVKFR